MTYNSQSRGLMYTAPPKGEDDVDVRPEKPSLDAPEDADDAAGADAEDGTPDRSSPDLEPTSATTDANWTGTVPADSTVPADD